MLARDAALAVDGVLGLDAGPTELFMTAGGGVRVGGVRSVAAPEGGFEVTLRLVCALVPLPALADRVREAVTRHITGVGDELQSVTVVVADVAVPEEGGR